MLGDVSTRTWSGARLLAGIGMVPESSKTGK